MSETKETVAEMLSSVGLKELASLAHGTAELAAFIFRLTQERDEARAEIERLQADVSRAHTMLAEQSGGLDGWSRRSVNAIETLVHKLGVFLLQDPMDIVHEIDKLRAAQPKPGSVIFEPVIEDGKHALRLWSAGEWGSMPGGYFEECRHDSPSYRVPIYRRIEVPSETSSGDSPLGKALREQTEKDQADFIVSLPECVRRDAVPVAMATVDPDKPMLRRSAATPASSNSSNRNRICRSRSPGPGKRQSMKLRARPQAVRRHPN